MAKDRLFIDEQRGVYHLTWWLADHDCEGASLDEVPSNLKGSQDEHIVASLAALAAKPDGVLPPRGFYWDSRDRAQAALRSVNAALKIAKAATPWPEWAKQALAAGWKQPKGWKP